MSDADVYDIPTRASGPAGELPLTAEMLLHRPSGDIFAWSQDAGMGWDAHKLDRPNFLVLSTQGGVRRPDGSPVALGYHTGHWEVGLLVEAAANEIAAEGGVPFAGFVSDPCDGRMQGTVGMMDSLPYRNDAALVLGRLIRTMPNRRGVLSVATCDKGLPAMLMALAAARDLPVMLVPGGVTLPPEVGEDAGKVQSLGARYAHGLITLQEAAEAGCRACATPGGGCQFFGTAATTQAVAEGLGLTLPHAALAPSGTAIWKEAARDSARALMELARRGITSADILTDAAIENAMLVHAACGGSTNLLLHIPAIAHAAGLRRPTVDDWERVNRQVPRLVDVLPNGPSGHPTVRLFLAGGVPEGMQHLRRLGLLHLDALTVTGRTVGENLDAWERSERRQRVREVLRRSDGVDPDAVIFSPERAAERGITSTVCFPRGNLCPEGSVIKATAIDPALLSSDGVYRKVGPAKVFTTERAAIDAIKGTHPDGRRVEAGDVVVLICRGPMGAGMEEVYEVTAALRYLPWARDVALLTDARFSGVSTGACIGHIGPEALAGGPIGRVQDGDLIEIVIDRANLSGTVNLVGAEGRLFGAAEGTRHLAARAPRADLAPDPELPEATRLWAALQGVSGGTWGGCVYDVGAILARLGQQP